MPLLDQNTLPGSGVAQFTSDAVLVWGRDTATEYTSGVMDIAAVDPGNSPTTILRPGLVLAQLSTGTWTNYSPTSATELQRLPWGVLNMPLNMLNFITNSANQKSAQIIIKGQLIGTNLYGLDENVRANFYNRFIFDDRLLVGNGGWLGPIDLTANRTVVASDSGKSWTNYGAGATITITLPTPGAGMRFRFVIGAAFTIVINSASAGQLIVPGNAAASTYTLAATLGASVEIFATNDGTKLLLTPNVS